MFRIQNITVELNKDSIHFKQDNKEFILKTDPFRGEPEEEYWDIVNDLKAHPKFVPLNLDVIRSALASSIINEYDESEAENRVITCVAQSVVREIILRYGIHPDKLHIMTSATAVIETKGEIFCVSLSSTNYIVVCHDFKHVDRKPSWEEMSKFKSRKQLEETVITERLHNIRKYLGNDKDEDTL